MEKLRLVKALSNKKDSSTELTRVRKSTNALANDVARLQSLFTWIFYLFSLFARYLDS